MKFDYENKHWLEDRRQPEDSYVKSTSCFVLQTSGKKNKVYRN